MNTNDENEGPEKPPLTVQQKIFCAVAAIALSVTLAWCGYGGVLIRQRVMELQYLTLTESFVAAEIGHGGSIEPLKRNMARVRYAWPDLGMTVNLYNFDMLPTVEVYLDSRTMTLPEAVGFVNSVRSLRLFGFALIISILSLFSIFTVIRERRIAAWDKLYLCVLVLGMVLVIYDGRLP